MGCSASRHNTLLTKSHQHQHHHHCQENNNYLLSSSSPCYSALDNSSATTFSSSNAHFSSSSPQTISRVLSLPAPLVHHPPSRKGDTHHLVSLTSTTYGSLRLIDPPQFPTLSPDSQPKTSPKPLITSNNTTQTNPVELLSPDSVINTWELMDGLDDDFDDCHPSLNKNDILTQDSPPLKKPLWKHLSEESLLSKMDPNVASSYTRALSSRHLGYINHHRPKNLSLVSSPATPSLSNNDYNFTKDQILIYFTSLRGIRKTYEDCCSVRMIFKGFRVAADERDISMDSTYRSELQSLLGGKAISLPQVFIRGKHIGGAEEIKQLNEGGELAKLLEGFAVIDSALVCKSCGDARFVPCTNCCGSRKVFVEEKQQLRRCLDCNENGLIRCPACCF